MKSEPSTDTSHSSKLDKVSLQIQQGTSFKLWRSLWELQSSCWEQTHFLEDSFFLNRNCLKHFKLYKYKTSRHCGTVQKATFSLISQQVSRLQPRAHRGQKDASHKLARILLAFLNLKRPLVVQCGVPRNVNTQRKKRSLESQPYQQPASSSLKLVQLESLNLSPRKL